MEKFEVVRQPLHDWTTFDGGAGDWQLRRWMPPDREVRAELRAGAGRASPAALALWADGRAGDGAFFLERRLPAPGEDGIRFAQVSWWFALPSLAADAIWPRLLYLGAPRALEMEDVGLSFIVLAGSTGLIPAPEAPGWYGHIWRRSFDPPLPELQVCLGWAVAREAEAEFLIDDILVLGR